MVLEEKLNLIKQVGEEIVTEEELTQLLTSGEKLIAYDGFEPSGQMHIAQGILRAIFWPEWEKKITLLRK